MPNYVIFDAKGEVSNVIVCNEWDVLPDGYTKQLIPEYHNWDWKKKEIVKHWNAPIIIENI